MTDEDNSRSLIPTPSREVILRVNAQSRIVSEMVENSLIVAHNAAREIEKLEALVREARRIQGSSAGTAPENVKAFKLFLRAARAGHPRAQYEVGYCFAFGVGVGYDSVQSRYWIGLAAENGYAKAQNKVANGLIGEGKFAEAAEWYRKAAEQGDPASQIGLSDCYCGGKGVAQDYCQAYAWARLAADADEVAHTVNGDLWFGPELSQEQATAFAATLSPTELDQARELYSDFRRRYLAKS